MSRLKNAILAKDQAYAGHAPNLDLAYGGMNGVAAAIGRIGQDGNNYDEWVSNKAYVRRNIIPVVISYPKAFDFFSPDIKKKLVETYNALMTLHPLTIDGLQSGLTVEFDEHDVGGAGEKQEEITNVTRARTVVSKTYKEKEGKAIQKFIDFVIRYLYLDPDTDKPLVSNLISAESAYSGIYTPDYYTGTHLYIEPDVMQKHVVDAYLCTNMMFKSNGDRTSKRDIHSAKETLDLSIEFTSITMSNESVRKLADTVLAGLNVLNTDPNIDMVVPQSTIDAALKDSSTGYNSVDYNSVPKPTAAKKA